MKDVISAARREVDTYKYTKIHVENRNILYNTPGNFIGIEQSFDDFDLLEVIIAFLLNSPLLFQSDSTSAVGCCNGLCDATRFVPAILRHARIMSYNSHAHVQAQ